MTMEQEHKQEHVQEHMHVEKVPVQENARDTSQQIQQITSDVPKTKPMKNPGRVAAVKAFAARNKKIREEKRQKQASISKNETKKYQHEHVQDESQNMSGFYLLSIAGFIVSLLGMYYKRQEVLAMVKATKKEAKQVPTKEENVKEAKLVNMD